MFMSSSQTLVVKLGTSVLTGGPRRLGSSHIVELVRQCAKQRKRARDNYCHVRTIAAGREYLNYDTATIASKQLLLTLWAKCFNSGMETLFAYGIHIGQMFARGYQKMRERF